MAKDGIDVDYFVYYHSKYVFVVSSAQIKVRSSQPSITSYYVNSPTG